MVDYLKDKSDETFKKYAIKFQKLLLSKIPESERICNKCYDKINEERKKEKNKPKDGKVCEKCGLSYDDEDVLYCKECGGKVKFKNYCHNCKKPTYTKYCTICGEKIIN